MTEEARANDELLNLVTVPNADEQAKMAKTATVTAADEWWHEWFPSGKKYFIAHFEARGPDAHAKNNYQMV